jgi:hypothetical protein
MSVWFHSYHVGSGWGRVIWFVAYVRGSAPAKFCEGVTFPVQLCTVSVLASLLSGRLLGAELHASTRITSGRLEIRRKCCGRKL